MDPSFATFTQVLFWGMETCGTEKGANGAGIDATILLVIHLLDFDCQLLKRFTERLWARSWVLFNFERVGRVPWSILGQSQNVMICSGCSAPFF